MVQNSKSALIGTKYLKLNAHHLDFFIRTPFRLDLDSLYMN